jgi:ABC-2 type transport system permease protein
MLVTKAVGPTAARGSVDEDQAAAAIIIPAGFTRSIIPSGEQFDTPDPAADPVKIEVYANPSRPTSAGIVKSIVDEFISRVEEDRLVGMTAITQMIASGQLVPEEAGPASEAMAVRMTSSPELDVRIALHTEAAGDESAEFNVLAYLAPGMALMFLMFTTSYAGRSLLAERNQGETDGLANNQRPGAGRQGVGDFLYRRGAIVHPDRSQHAFLPLGMG